MKNAILILFTAFLLGLSSCKKDAETYCYECTEYRVTVQAGIVVGEEEIETATYCGVQENQEYMFEHELLLYYDSFTSIYSIKTCNKTEAGIPQN
jgi:hypothetical protein